MGKTINILGDTPKQQWLNAIMIFEECIYGNVRNAYDGALNGFGYDEEEDERIFDQLEIAMRETRNFAAEMRRLVEGVFDDGDKHKEEE